jgi:putative phosphonate metabolism protein
VTVRYAVYFAPPAESALWRFGSSVIGYDAVTGEAIPQFAPTGVAAGDWHALTGDPRRYGFHATLKAPFRLAAGTMESELLADVADLAASVASFDLTLRVEPIGSFVAFVPAAVPPELAALEEAVVSRFDRFRAPLTESEIARRERTPLSSRQRTLLVAYGYPYVLDQFRFHMSLSGSLPTALITPVASALADAASHAGIATTALDRLAVFQEIGGQFRVLRAFPFKASSRR